MSAAELIRRARTEMGFTSVAAMSRRDGVWLSVLLEDRIHIHDPRELMLFSKSPDEAWEWLSQRFPKEEP